MTQRPDLNRFQAPCFFFSCERRGELTYLSPSVEAVLGYSPEQLLGTNYYDLLLPDHLANVHVQRHGAPCGNDICHVTRAVRTASGEEKILSIQIYNDAEADTDASQSTGQPSPASRSHGLAMDVTMQWRMVQTLQSHLEKVSFPEDQLTDREKRVLDLLLGGALNKSMARELDVSERTIEMDRARLMKKLSASSAAQLVSIATEARLLNDALGSLSPADSQAFFGDPH